MTDRGLPTASILALVALAAGCQAPFNDPLRTGLQLSPIPGDHVGPVDLIVRNRTGEAMACQAFEADDCASLTDLLDQLVSLPDGESARAEGVSCAYIDITCAPEGWDGASQPTRAWGWAINPPLDEQ
ncbi:MAG TPA: hypothetical protein PKA64_15620 [Myxococcota bacterium]|nr:hypothetical protein [Myxococcota bacterium]